MNTSKILIIDDDPSMLEILSTIIQKKDNYACTLANSALKGLELANTLQPDIVILDITMPGMNGYEVCREIKKQKNTKDIPVIFLTASNDVRAKIAAFECGASDYIGKPFEPAEVIARIKAHIDLRKSQQENLKYHKILYKTRHLASLTSMVAGFSHNFNNLLSIISSQLQLLKKDATCINTVYDKVDKTIERITQLIERLMIFSEAKEATYQKINVNPILKNILDMFSEKVASRIHIHSDIDNTTLYIMANVDKFWKMMDNLLINACESIEGKGDIYISTGRENIELQNKNTQCVYIEVKDTGKGISPENLPKVFDPFFSTKFTVGVGLGLTMCHALMQRWEGSIVIESIEGESTTVRLYFKECENDKKV